MRLSEIYASVQGEGPRVGVPTIFVRFAGCNLKCPGWPCDTQHAIDPALYRHEWKEWGVEQFYDEIRQVTTDCGIRNVCFTGGEPFLQPQDKFRQLVSQLYARGYEMEVFTNGTLPWQSWAIYSLRFIMDWKLSGSGETIEHLGVVMDNASRLTKKDAIKFTIANTSDLEEAYEVWMKLFVDTKVDLPQFFCGPVWNMMEPDQIVDFILSRKLPWRLNIQAHKYIWEASARRT